MQNKELQICRHHAITKTREGCTLTKIIEESKKAIPDYFLSKMQVYNIIKIVKNRDDMGDNKGG